MGPIQLRVKDASLYQGWDNSRRGETDGFKGDKPGLKQVQEAWVCRPPNMLMFQINRVQYDPVEQKVYKEYSRFDFDKTIYIDLFLNKNRERAEKNRLDLQQMGADLKVLKMQRSQFIDPMDRSIVDTL